ncbi:MAG: VWA domain-containing protein [Acidobacteriota bacterium]|nr:VWA domain-containing protein [Acidobacteriota bacterium]
MSFLAPLFLLGSLLVAVPIVLHLTRRRREPVPFPSFLLLQLTSATARFKRRRFRNIPLLILRCLALLLLAAAFAEPVLRGAALAGGEGAALDRAVLVDRSLSMTVGNRMAAAREAAQAELSGLGRDDRAIVVAFDGRAAALTELTGDRGTLAPAVANLTAGGGGTSYTPALGLAGRLLPASPGRRREVVLISDLQRSGFEEGRPQPSLPPGVELRVRAVSAAPPANAWIADVTVVSEGREQLVVSADVGFAPSPANPEWSGEIELLLSGRSVDRTGVTAAADRMTTARFTPILRPSEPLAAEVRLPEDGFPGDNSFHLVIHPEAAIRVADLDGNPPSVYVSEALGVGVAPGFLLDRAPARGEGAVRGALEAVQVALVRDPGRLDAGATRALGDFVEGGGGLVMATGPRRLSRAASEELAAFAPAVPEGFVDRDPAGRLGDLAARHPLFEPFGGEGSAVLSALAFFRYRELARVRPDAAVLARFDDGKPAIVESEWGEGRILLFASSLDAEWTDLPRRAAFVPLLHRMVEVAAGHERIPIAYRVGESVDPGAAFRLPSGSAGEGDEVLADSPSEERTVLGGRDALRLTEPGFYRARRPGTAEFRQIGVNPPLAESDLRTLDAAEVRMAAVASVEGEAPAAANPVAPDLPGRAVGWLLLAGLLLLLVSEAWAANRSAAPGRLPA